jgi:hypothetical protein
MSPPRAGFLLPKRKIMHIRIDCNYEDSYSSLIESRNSPSRGPQRIGPLFNSLRNTNKDGTASTATGDQIAPKGYQREAHLDG